MSVWLERHKSASDIAKAPSEESIFECSPQKSEKPPAPFYEDIQHTQRKDRFESLTDTIFCALFPFFGQIISVSVTEEKKNVEVNAPESADCAVWDTASSQLKLQKKAKGTSRTKVLSSGNLVMDSSVETITSRKRSRKNKKKLSVYSVTDENKNEVFGTSGIYNAGDESLDVITEDMITAYLSPQFRDIFQLLEVYKDKVHSLWLSSKVYLEFYNGNSYYGSVLKCSFEEKGRYSWKDKSTYKGSFENSEAKDEGHLELPDGRFYHGQFLNNVRHGDGFFFKQDNISYNGEWVNGKKQRRGKIAYGEDNWYEGEILNGKREGIALRHYPSNSRYHGEWLNGMKHGYGIMYWSSGEMYTGYWENGLMNGEGKLVWETYKNDQFVYPMQNYYKGEWKDGIRHGSGMLFLSTGAVIWTQWVDGIKHGCGRVLCCNGTTVEADPMFVHDNVVVMRRVKSTNKNEVKALKGSRSHFSLVDFFQDEGLDEAAQVEYPTSCFIPVNMPPYMMSLDFHLNLYFSTSWTKSFNFDAELRTYFLSCEGKNAMPNFIKHRLKYFDDYNKQQKQQSASQKGGGDSKSILGGGKVKEKKVCCAEPIKTFKPNYNVCFRKCPPPTVVTTLAPMTELERKALRRAPRGLTSSKFLNKKSVTFYAPNSLSYDPKTYRKELNDYIEDSKKNMTNEMKIRAFRFERQWLRLILSKFSKALSQLYRQFSLVCCTREPKFDVGMMKIMLWHLLLNVGLTEANLSVMEFDRICVGKKCDPFDFVPKSEMIHYLLVLSWHLMTKNGLTDPSIPGVLAGGFQMLMIEKIIPSLKQSKCVLFPYFNEVSLESLWNMYQSIGPCVTVRSLLQTIFKERPRIEPSTVKMSEQIFRNTSIGRNCILPGGGIYYQVSQDNSQQTIIAESLMAPEDTLTQPVSLERFAELGEIQVMDIIISCCPLLKIPNTDRLNTSYQELSFLEFCKIIVLLGRSYASECSPNYEPMRDKIRKQLHLRPGKSSRELSVIMEESSDKSL